MTLVGLFVGVIWGVVVEAVPMRSVKPLLVFYDNTPGGLYENRAGDGLSIALASFLVALALRVVDPTGWRDIQ
jgi:hypothetical protein